MIIVRSPLRISLGGGGTDLPSYYRDHEGFLVAAAIDKYVYVSIIKPFKPGVYLKYSEIEHVDQIDQVKHRIMREVLSQFADAPPQIEITTLADIPAGTGLGSSGSFTTALLKALHEFNHKFIHPHELAELACHVEIDCLQEPIGKQDQFIAAYGGVTAFTFAKDGKVAASPVKLDDDTRHNLETHLLLFFTGFSRSASSILKDQDERTKAQELSIIDNLHYVKDLGHRSHEALIAGDLRKFGALMHEHWEHKRRRSAGMSNPQIDEAYKVASKNGAIGGKLIGAGGGGFLMFYTEAPAQLRAAMRAHGLIEMPFYFDTQGTKVLNP